MMKTQNQDFTPANRPRIMNLLCQVAGGLWTGLGWVTPDRVDKLLLGHTVRQGRSGWGRQVIIRTASAMRQPVDRVRPHPDLKGVEGMCSNSVAPFHSFRVNTVASTTATRNENRPNWTNQFNR